MRLGYPPPVYVLLLLQNLGRIRRRDVHTLLHGVKLRGVDLGYEFVPSFRGYYSRELDMDLAMLKALGLVKESGDGYLELTEKGVKVVSSLLRHDDPTAKNLTKLVKGYVQDKSSALTGNRR